MPMRNTLLTAMLALLAALSLAQGREEEARDRRLPGIKTRLSQMGLGAGGTQLFIRAFKLDAQVEAWVRDDSTGWMLFRTYPMCAVSGLPGRKMLEGDRQVPEGVYRITEFNDRSQYHMSLKINYPNEADHYWADSARPGGEIYFHGGCATIGCLPLTDPGIEELYTLARMSRPHIPVHIFSVRFSSESSWRRLQTYAYVKEDMLFQLQMMNVFDHFERYREIPVVTVDTAGRYIVR